MTAPETCEPARHLWVAVPAYTGSVSAETTHALVEGAMLLQRHGVKMSFDGMTGCCYLDHARNLLVASFLESDATDLLFVDADLGFAPEALLRIATVRRPFVAGLYRLKQDAEKYTTQFINGFATIDDEGLIEAKHVATGFLRLNRAVFGALKPVKYRYQFLTGEVHVGKAWFKTEIAPDGGQPSFWGEDFQFCRDWKAIGGKIHAIPDLTMAHLGTKAWVGNWARHMEEIGKAKRA